MATPAPITGQTYVSIGYTITLSDAVAGGTWSSSNTAIATVGASTGIVTGISLGAVTITYTTVDGFATYAINVNPVTISNGFNVNDLFPVMQKRIGWLPSTLDDTPTISADNQTSYSGRYYNDNSFHSAVSIDNLYSCQEDSGITDDEFNTLLDRLDKSVIMRTVNSVFNRPALIEHKTMYRRTWNVLNVQIPNGGNFVGYRINIAAGNYAVQFNAISLYFNGAATFNLYMYNDLVKEPLHVKEVTTVANSQTRVSLDWIVNYVNLHNLGGVIFIGYYQNDIEAQGVLALDEQLNLWDSPIVFGGYPFQAAQTGTGAGLDFYRINPSIVYRTYGLNLEISSYRDYTQTIMQNAHLFDEARGLAMAIIVISMLKNTNRANGIERLTADYLNDLKVETELAFPTQEMPFMAGLKANLVRAFKQLNDNFWPKATAQVAQLGNPNGIADYLGMNINEMPPRQNIV